MNGRVKSTQAETGKILNLSRSTVAKIEHEALDIMYQNLPQSGDGNIYWALASISEDKIILNGCQGDVYEWKKPNN